MPEFTRNVENLYQYFVVIKEEKLEDTFHSTVFTHFFYSKRDPSFLIIGKAYIDFNDAFMTLNRNQFLQKVCKISL